MVQNESGIQRLHRSRDFTTYHPPDIVSHAKIRTRNGLVDALDLGANHNAGLVFLLVKDYCFYTDFVIEKDLTSIIHIIEGWVLIV